MDVPVGRFRRLAITGLLATSLFTGAQAALAQSTPLPADVLFDDAESTNGWGTGAPNVISRNTASKKSGAASVQSVGNSPLGRFSKTRSTPIDVSGMRYLTFWYYVDDISLIAPNSGQVEISSAGTFNREESNWNVHDLHLHRGWNWVVLDLPGTPTGGGADLTRINFFSIYHNATGSITTRIDRVAFTNREPDSLAFSKLVENKRIAADYSQSASLTPMLNMIFEMPVNDPERQKVCRQMQLDQLHREISAASLVKVGVPQNVVNNDVAKKKLIKDFICGQSASSPEVVANVVSQSAQADVALASEIRRLYDVTQQAAAEIRDRVLELDLTRILGKCGADGNDINNFVQTGAVPRGMLGLSVLTPDCKGGASEIALLLGGADPLISDRAGRFRQCMAQFTNKGSECNNPYANPDDDFNGKMKELVPHFGQPYVDLSKQVMRNRLELIESTSIQNVNRRFTEPFNSTYEQNDPPLEETQPTSGQVPNYQQQVELHRQYDNARSKAYGAEKYEWQAERTLRSIPNESKPAQAEAEAFRQRYHAERVKWELEAAKIQAQICENDPKNEVCQFGPPPPPPEPEPENGPKPEARCANMEFEDGSAAWFNKPAGDSGFSRQINEGDRIDHCLCDLFDRGYIDSLPGSEFTSTYSGCPTAEERIAQECLANPYGPNDGIRRECLHIMQPSSLDRDVLNARMCQVLRPDCENRVYTDEAGNCGCAVAVPGGGGAVTLPSCSQAINCGPDAVPSTIGCGCQPIDSGGNACTDGGKDFYLTKNPLQDLLVRAFPTRPNLAGRNVLMVKTGDTRFVTPAIRRNQLFNANTFNLDVVLPAPSYSGTGSIEVRCSNVNTGTANRLIETISMQGMVPGAVNSIQVNLDAADRTACYGSGNSNRTHFEFRVNTPANQPVGFADILGGLGDIKPVCVRTPRPTPSPGPRPLSVWPDTWTFGDGQTIEPVFNGVGPITIPGGTLPGELCIEDGHIVPCD